MLADLLTGLMIGIGFMAGTLVIYTMYDISFTAIERKRAKAAAAKRKKRRH